MIHDRLTGPDLFGLPLDQRALDGCGYGAEPWPVAGVVGDLEDAAEEQGATTEEPSEK